MGKRRVKAVTPGKRTGTKRRDMRWTAPDGTIWGSRFEYEVFRALKDQGYEVRKTGPQDRMAYTSPVRNGKCLQCESCRVVTEHHYTPDLFVSTESGSGKRGNNELSGYYLEVKGYLRSPRRALLRSFAKARPDVAVCILAQRDYRVGKSSLVGWATKYLKWPAAVWTGELPKEWRR